MGAYKNQQIDEVNAELERHEKCEIKDTTEQDADDGVWYISGQCLTHKESVSADFMHEMFYDRFN